MHTVSPAHHGRASQPQMENRTGIYESKSAHKWTHTVLTHVVQRPTAASVVPSISATFPLQTQPQRWGDCVGAAGDSWRRGAAECRQERALGACNGMPGLT